MREWWAARTRVVGDDHPKVMGIVNVTPDSFSDGGEFLDPDAAAAHAHRLAEEGADLIDLGGASSRPGASPVPVDEELRRVRPVLERLRGTLQVPLSIDTDKPEVARAALALGATIVNDIGGLRDPDMARAAADAGASVVLMHMAGTPPTMQENPTYRDVVAEVRDQLARGIDAAESAGIPRNRIAIDPGIGFGKKSIHNLLLLQNLNRLHTLGCAIVVGTSRKRFLGAMTNRPVGQRLAASIVSSLAAIERGAHVVRVHDVAAMVDALTVWHAVMKSEPSARKDP